MIRRIVTCLLCVGLMGCVTKPGTPMPSPGQRPSARDIKPTDFDVPPAPTASQVHASPSPARPAGRLGGSWVPPVPPRVWRYVVVHHSASESGSIAVFDREHRAKGWDEIGYHFVIGNGRGAPDGQIAPTVRWTTQKYGAHTRTSDQRYNQRGVGICLVGNFETGRPTERQMESLHRLLAWLMVEYDIPPNAVIGHRDAKSTACPGRNLSLAAVRRGAVRRITAAGLSVPPVPLASSELVR